ncbi:MAG: hypothetical protein MPJ06_04010 [Nitrosopumilus sp.]|nr:hypothetical protein [Nitrosopumilus sp.]
MRGYVAIAALGGLAGILNTVVLYTTVRGFSWSDPIGNMAQLADMGILVGVNALAIISPILIKQNILAGAAIITLGLMGWFLSPFTLSPLQMITLGILFVAGIQAFRWKG